MGEILSGHHILFSHSILETHKSAFTLTQKLKKVEIFFVRAKTGAYSTLAASGNS